MATYDIRALEPNEAAQAVELWNELSGGAIGAETLRRIRTHLVMVGSTDFNALVLEADEVMRGIATLRMVSHPVTGKRGEIEAFLVDSKVPAKQVEEFARRCTQWLQDREAVMVTHNAPPGTASVFEQIGFSVDVVRWSLS